MKKFPEKDIPKEVKEYMAIKRDESMQYATDIMDSFLQPHHDLVNKLYSEIATSLSKKKEDLIRVKLIEKGFGHLIDGLKTRRFPKICCVRQGQWELYFADDNSDEGAFIIGFKDVYLNPILDDRKYTAKATIKYQDTLPLINKQ